MGARRPVAEVQVTVIVMMMVVAVIVAMFMVVVMPVRLAVAFQPRALTLTASAYRAHRFYLRVCE